MDSLDGKKIRFSNPFEGKKLVIKFEKQVITSQGIYPESVWNRMRAEQEQLYHEVHTWYDLPDYIREDILEQREKEERAFFNSFGPDSIFYIGEDDEEKKNPTSGAHRIWPQRDSTKPDSDGDQASDPFFSREHCAVCRRLEAACRTLRAPLPEEQEDADEGAESVDSGSPSVRHLTSYELMLCTKF